MNIQLILENHKKWLLIEKTGIKADLEGADLRGADLRGTELQCANLQRADLQYADLRGAKLEGADLRGADLRGADLRGAELQCANLRGVNLLGANLQGADLDFSIINLSCKDLGIHLDDRLVIQRFYHLLYNVNFSKNISKELKDILLTEDLIKMANKFHRVDECRKII